jgi:hypothetical protein
MESTGLHGDGFPWGIIRRLVVGERPGFDRRSGEDENQTE